MKREPLHIVREAVTAHAEAVARLDPLLPHIETAARIMEEALARGGRLFFCGNGGSAADAQHLAAEFTGRFLFERAPLDAQALHTNTSALTAVGNDYGFDRVFSRQVAAHGRAGDVLVGLSTSGSSRNVVRAMDTARETGMTVIALTGPDACDMTDRAHVSLSAPATSTPRIQELHMLMGHILCELVEEALCARDGVPSDSETFHS